MDQRSPRIERLEWGEIVTEAGTFRDARLWPGGGRDWDWRETGTEHSPGVQPSDVAELLDHGAEVVVVGRGQRGRLGVTDEAARAVEDAGARLEVHDSGDAVDRYNALVEQGALVGALVHTTC